MWRFHIWQVGDYVAKTGPPKGHFFFGSNPSASRSVFALHVDVACELSRVFSRWQLFGKIEREHTRWDVNLFEPSYWKNQDALIFQGAILMACHVWMYIWNVQEHRQVEIINLIPCTKLATKMANSSDIFCLKRSFETHKIRKWSA